MMMMMMMMINCFCGMLTDERRLALLQLGPLSEILTITNLQHAASRVWIYAEPEFRVSWPKLCSSDSHCISVSTTTVTTNHYSVSLGTDPPSKPQPSNFLCALRHWKLLSKFTWTDKKSWWFQYVAHV